MKVLVTGGTGFIGSALIRALAAQGNDIIATSRFPQFDNSSRVTWHAADLTGGVDWHALVDQVEVIYHLAWASLPATSQVDPAADANTNLVGSLRLLQAVRDKPHVRFVFASSGGTVYGKLLGRSAAESHPTRPVSMHGVAKLAMEHYLRALGEAWGIDAVSARIGNPYGPSQRIDRAFGAVTTAVSRAIRSETWKVFGDGGHVRDYIFIDDLTSALIALGSLRGGPSEINIATGEGHSLNQVATLVGEVLGTRLRLQHQEPRPFDVPSSVLDIGLAQSTLGWRPSISLRAGIEMTSSEMRRQSSYMQSVQNSSTR